MFKLIIEENQWLSRPQLLSEWSRFEKEEFFNVFKREFEEAAIELSHEHKMTIEHVIDAFEEEFAQDHADMWAECSHVFVCGMPEFGFDVS